MIYSISGLLRQVAPTYCVVEACGVGYQMCIRDRSCIVHQNKTPIWASFFFW